ncbi:MAG: HigA family addiction module antitoxin [Candidatus Caenarcaniphilales bacterium]|nr:HigA family addiction module antitoxin [Candidatus Caenarcaniphilales bacterium]
MKRIKTLPREILLEEFMEPFGLSANALAIALRTDATTDDLGVDEIIKCKRSITSNTALKLARHFKTSPQFWLNLQTNYDSKR